mmetsp:Transcript_27079/g.54043  ORF Transcript_27079/g.54043 Transcript_27079/m.54043 type:complete len:209 (-) Transcript_27079:1672-2298(-)
MRPSSGAAGALPRALSLVPCAVNENPRIEHRHQLIPPHHAQEGPTPRLDHRKPVVPALVEDPLHARRRLDLGEADGRRGHHGADGVPVVLAPHVVLEVRVAVELHANLIDALVEVVPHPFCRHRRHDNGYEELRLPRPLHEYDAQADRGALHSDEEGSDSDEGEGGGGGAGHDVVPDYDAHPAPEAAAHEDAGHEYAAWHAGPESHQQ